MDSKKLASIRSANAASATGSQNGLNSESAKISEICGKKSENSAPKAQSDWVYALKDVSFEVKRGEVLGIIGRNGAGKSTLLKILSRVTTQSEGRIKVKGRIASLLEVGTGFHPELTVPSEVSFALHGPRRETEGWAAWSKSNRRLAQRVQRRRGGANQNIFLNGAILGMRKAEPERRGGAEEGCRRQARRDLQLGKSANQIARKFDEIVEFSGCARYIDMPVQSYSSGMSVRLGFAVNTALDPAFEIVKNRQHSRFPLLC
jgi:lipopolysaccharide transport system ATP-binding protein